MADLRERARTMVNIVIDTGDWSVKQLEDVQSAIIEKFERSPRVPHIGVGLSTKRGVSQVVVRVTPEFERAALDRVSQLSTAELGGVDPAAVLIEPGEVGRGEPGEVGRGEPGPSPTTSG